QVLGDDNHSADDFQGRRIEIGPFAFPGSLHLVENVLRHVAHATFRYFDVKILDRKLISDTLAMQLIDTRSLSCAKFGSAIQLNRPLNAMITHQRRLGRFWGRKPSPFWATASKAAGNR